MGEIKNIFKQVPKLWELVKYFMNTLLWIINITDEKSLPGRIIRYIRLAYMVGYNCWTKKIGRDAIVLSYYCFMAIVPSLAMAFAVTDRFKLRDKFEGIITRILGDYAEIANNFLESADKVLDTASSGPIGLVSAGIIIWLAFSMLLKVGEIFNDVWGKPTRGILIQLFSAFWVLILIPFAIIILSTGSVVYSNVLGRIFDEIHLFNHTFNLGILQTGLSWVIFGAIIVFMISMMYKFIPHVKVVYKYALISALITGICFTALQFLYIKTQIMVARTNMIYGSFAAIPLFFVWIQYGWWLIIFGCHLSYALQNEESIEESYKQNIQSGKDKIKDQIQGVGDSVDMTMGQIREIFSALKQKDQ